MERIKKTAEDFGLIYDPRFFNYILATREELVLRNFISGCPEYNFEKFGKTLEKRVKNIGRFVNSSEFKKHVKEAQGCVINKIQALQEQRFIRSWARGSWRKKLLKVYDKILVHCIDELILVFKPETKKEQAISEGVLSHELMHQLLDHNNIEFAKLNSKNWEIDEGLATYLDHYSIGKHKLLEKKQKKGKSEMHNIYAENGRTFALLLNKLKTPQQRIDVLRKYYDKMKR